MSAQKILIPLPVCESCWISDHSKWEPESMDHDGNILMKLVMVDVPEKKNTSEPDTCSQCGNLTIAGIYKMSDPTVLFFSPDGLIKSRILVSDDEDDLWSSEE